VESGKVETGEGTVPRSHRKAVPDETKELNMWTTALGIIALIAVLVFVAWVAEGDRDHHIDREDD